MRTIWRKPKIDNNQKRFLVNEQITVSEVFLIDENGEKIGPTPTFKALQMAREVEMDLVQVDPRGQPPVAKIIDYGQFKYEQDKKAHKQKAQQKKVDIKCVRLSMRISQHDLNIRIEQAKRFLEKGDKLKLELNLKGREKQHSGKALEIINNFIDSLKKIAGLNITIEQDLTKQGGKYSMVLINRK